MKVFSVTALAIFCASSVTNVQGKLIYDLRVFFGNTSFASVALSLFKNLTWFAVIFRFLGSPRTFLYSTQIFFITQLGEEYHGCYEYNERFWQPKVVTELTGINSPAE